MEILGTDQAPVVLAAVDATAGFEGIHFDESAHPSNNIAWAAISGAGNHKFSACPVAATICLGQSGGVSSVTIDSVTLSAGRGYGLALDALS